MKTAAQKPVEIWTAGRPASKAILGGKGFNLSKLLEEQTMNVPNFIVLTPAAFFNSLNETDRVNWSTLDDAKRRRVVETLILSGATRLKLLEELDSNKLADFYLAVRSSAIDEALDAVAVDESLVI